MLLMVLDTSDHERGVREAYRILRTELAAFSKHLNAKPHCVVFNKMDMEPVNPEEDKALQNELEAIGIVCFRTSGLLGEGVPQMIYTLDDMVRAHKAAEKESAPLPMDLDEESELETSGSIDPLDEI